MPELIDTHCHLDIAEFDTERDALIGRCAAAGMQAILVPGIAAEGWQKLHQVCAGQALFWPAFGMHPCYVEAHRPEHLAALEACLEMGAVAVGEIGLDAFHGDADMDRQLEFFAAQVAIAKTHRLPLVVHARKTHDLILKELRRQKFAFGGAIHAFSGSLQQAEQFIDMGFVIGFGGGATYDRANKLRRILRTIPLTSVVLETDAPDIPPSFARGEPNSPWNLFRIADILAGVMDIPLQTLAATTTANARRIFTPD